MIGLGWLAYVRTDYRDSAKDHEFNKVSNFVWGFLSYVKDNNRELQVI